MINSYAERRFDGLVLIVIAVMVLFAPTSEAELMIDVAREELPDRKECRADFKRIWEKEFRTAQQKFQIYNNAWSDLREQKKAFEDAKYEAETWKTVSDFAIGVKLIAGITNTGLGAAADKRKLIPKDLKGGITIASATIDWVVEKYRQGDYTVGQVINSFATNEFHAHTLKAIAASKSVLLDASMKMHEFVEDYERQEKEYTEYRKTLRELIDKTDTEITATRQSMAREQDRLFDLYHNAFEIFCQNENPVAKNDRAEVDAGTKARIDVLENDRDPESRALTVRNPPIVVAGQGRAGVGQNDQVIFTPADGFSGQAIVDYEIVDDLGGVARARIYINVTPDPIEQALEDQLLQAAMNTMHVQRETVSYHDAAVRRAETGREEYVDSVWKEQNRRVTTAAISRSSPSISGGGFSASSRETNICVEGALSMTRTIDSASAKPSQSQGICNTARSALRQISQMRANPSIRNCPDLNAELQYYQQYYQDIANRNCAN